MPPIEGDASLNLSLPARAEFADGMYDEWNQGVYFTNVHGHQLFLRAADISKASTKFLWNLRKGCIMTANDHKIITLLDQELMKPERQRDPAYIQLKQESVWD